MSSPTQNIPSPQTSSITNTYPGESPNIDGADLYPIHQVPAEAGEAPFQKFTESDGYQFPTHQSAVLDQPPVITQTVDQIQHTDPQMAEHEKIPMSHDQLPPQNEITVPQSTSDNKYPTAHDHLPPQNLHVVLQTTPGNKYPTAHDQLPPRNETISQPPPIHNNDGMIYCEKPLVGSPQPEAIGTLNGMPPQPGYEFQHPQGPTGYPPHEAMQPTYAEAQLEQKKSRRNYLTSVRLANLQAYPAPIDCPLCGVREMTSTQYVSGGTTHATAALCCFCLCLGCIPYMATWFKDCEHRCGNCGGTVAVWHRSGRTEVMAHERL